jgi:hypothetical protein
MLLNVFLWALVAIHISSWEKFWENFKEDLNVGQFISMNISEFICGWWLLDADSKKRSGKGTEDKWKR